MATLSVTLDRKHTNVSVLLPGHTLALLPASLVLNMLKPTIDVRGLRATSPCVGHWVIYRKAERVGNISVVQHV